MFEPGIVWARQGNPLEVNGDEIRDVSARRAISTI